MIKPVRTDPFVFRGQVNKAGYEWLKGQDGEVRLVARKTPETWIRPFEPSNGLFREFATTNPNQNAILEFAKKYGDLFESYGVADFVNRAGGLTQGASLARWKAEIGDLRVLVEIWDQIQGRRIAELRKIIVCDPAKGVRYSIKTPKQEFKRWLWHRDWPESQPERFAPGDVLVPAQYALQWEINRRLADGQILTVPQLAWTPDHYRRLIFKPLNLLAAMWWQFAQAVTGEHQLKKCEGCGTYFQAGPGGRRADATTCSDACRQRKRRK